MANDGVDPEMTLRDGGIVRFPNGRKAIPDSPVNHECVIL